MDNQVSKGLNFSSVDLLLYMWKRRWILIIVTFLAGVSSIIISFQIKEKYRSTVVMFPTTGASVSKSLLGANYTGRQDAYGFGEEEQAEQLLQVLNSEQIRSRIIEKFNLMEHYGIDPQGKFPYTQLSEEYRDNITFRRTDLMSVEISVMDEDPQYAADIANEIAALIDTVYNNMKKERAIAAFNLVKREYLDAEKNVQALKDSLQKVGTEVSASMRNAGSSGVNQVVKALAGQGGIFITLNNQLDHETERLSDLRQRFQEARVETEQELPHKFIVDQAYPSEKKAYPKKSVIVLVSTAAAFLFTLILLIIVDSLQQQVAANKED